MMKNKLICLFVLGIFIYSCTDENLNDIAENQFVVEAFIYAGEPIDDIRIKTSFPLSDEEDNSTPIDDAQVALIKDGQRFDLISSGNDGYYQYPGSDLEVATNDIFELEVIHNGITATAKTTVPTPTTGLSLSQDTVFVPRLPIGQGMEAIRMVIGDFIRNSTIEANWDNPNEDLYFVVVESLTEQNDPIFPDVVINALERFRFVSEPTNESSLTFLSGTLVSFGTYEVRVYHINEEYAALYENREQDSRDLNEPPSNVTNALGVFSAFNSQSSFFELASE
jgi:hypothetical protein